MAVRLRQATRVRLRNAPNKVRRSGTALQARPSENGPPQATPRLPTFDLPDREWHYTTNKASLDKRMQSWRDAEIVDDFHALMHGQVAGESHSHGLTRPLIL